MRIKENGIYFRDGCKTIFLSTKGQNEEEVPQSLVRFLRFVTAGLEESEKDFQDDFVKTLQESVYTIKGSREMEERFMTLEELLKDERREAKEEGRAEMILQLLGELGEVPGNIQEKILSETDISVLRRYLKAVVRAESMEEFLTEIQSF